VMKYTVILEVSDVVKNAFMRNTNV
jgi:hypothetical protein